MGMGIFKEGNGQCKRIPLVIIVQVTTGSGYLKKTTDYHFKKTNKKQAETFLHISDMGR